MGRGQGTFKSCACLSFLQDATPVGLAGACVLASLEIPPVFLGACVETHLLRSPALDEEGDEAESSLGLPPSKQQMDPVPLLPPLLLRIAKRRDTWDNGVEHILESRHAISKLGIAFHHIHGVCFLMSN